MVVVAAGDDAPVNAEDQVGRHRLACGERAKPAVGGVGCPQLPLRARQVNPEFGSGGERLFLLALGELGAFDAGRADGLQAELLLVGLLDPLREARHPVENACGGLGLDQRPGDGGEVISRPLLRESVMAYARGCHIRLVSGFISQFRS